MFNWLKQLYSNIVREIKFRRRIKELRKRDPFNYH